MFKKKNIWTKKLYISENLHISWEFFIGIMNKIGWFNKDSYIKGERISLKINSSKQHADIVEFIEKDKFILKLSKKNIGEQIYTFDFVPVNRKKHTVIKISMEIKLLEKNQNNRIASRNDFKIYFMDLNEFVRNELDKKGFNSFY